MRASAVTRQVPAAGARSIQAARPNASVPAAKVPAPAPVKQRRLLGFDLLFTNMQPDRVVIEPATKSMTMAPATYQWLKNDTAAMQDLGTEKAEAVRQMKVTMWNGASYAPKADPARKPPRPTPGIRQLSIDMAAFVGRLAAAQTDEQITLMALEYARYRDTMAALRAAFTEAEGSFELAQELLVQKMGTE